MTADAATHIAPLLAAPVAVVKPAIAAGRDKSGMTGSVDFQSILAVLTKPSGRVPATPPASQPALHRATMPVPPAAREAEAKLGPEPAAAGTPCAPVEAAAKTAAAVRDQQSAIALPGRAPAAAAPAVQPVVRLPAPPAGVEAQATPEPGVASPAALKTKMAAKTADAAGVIQGQQGAIVVPGPVPVLPSAPPHTTPASGDGPVASQADPTPEQPAKGGGAPVAAVAPAGAAPGPTPAAAAVYATAQGKDAAKFAAVLADAKASDDTSTDDKATKDAAAAPVPPGALQQLAAPPPAAAASHAAPTAAGATVASPAAQVAHMVAAVHVAPGAQGQVTIHLHPDDLGAVQVRIERAHDGTATVTVQVEKPQTLQTIQQDISHLHQALDRAGVPQEQRQLTMHLAAPAAPGSFGAGNETAGGGQNRQQPQSQARNAGHATNDPELQDDPETPRWRAAGVNITA